MTAPVALLALPEPKYLAKLSMDGEWAELVPTDDWRVQMWAYGTEACYTAEQMKAYALACLSAQPAASEVVEVDEAMLTELMHKVHDYFDIRVESYAVEGYERPAAIARATKAYDTLRAALKSALGGGSL
ncbi:MAG: hypothetical protein A3E01_04510 [Gammaproteobacteria bacterium RIFCSPHIGHO2_12_FULL_63_22]|nr:MAG: hypothetical protein A3E01_04510 [Gammaproteobacteria bacterium RIFCSPHIGHO2_12_FULL_63_22]